MARIVSRSAVPKRERTSASSAAARSFRLVVGGGIGHSAHGERLQRLAPGCASRQAGIDLEKWEPRHITRRGSSSSNW